MKTEQAIGLNHELKTKMIKKDGIILELIVITKGNDLFLTEIRRNQSYSIQYA